MGFTPNVLRDVAFEVAPILGRRKLGLNGLDALNPTTIRIVRRMIYNVNGFFSAVEKLRT